ncbi:MAG: ATP-binding protein [Anaerolineae bacterium]|nr:ATP-binding protein [Anaerolineae bacterium]
MDILQQVEQVSFSVSARVAMQLGRESISNSIVAIIELVKNAYDANANKVMIRFANLNTKNPLLIIEDNGDGMSKEQLINHWLVIGTTHKQDLSYSNAKQRVHTGEKGLGRLGLDRLCNKTIIKSLTNISAEKFELHVDWTKYEKNNQRLESVKHELYLTATFDDFPIHNKQSIVIKSGTQMILSDLKDEWDKDSIKNLQNELNLLLSPFSEVADFSVEIETNFEDFKSLDGSVSSSSLIENAEWEIFAELSPKDEVLIKITSRRNKIDYSEGPQKWSEVFNSKHRLPRCGPAIFKAFFFAREKTDLDSHIITKAQVSNFLNANQGIRIYRDGFRVKPYGDPKGEFDWLGLLMQKNRHPGGVRSLEKWHVGYNQLVGAVFISRSSNPNLVDQTNREGLMLLPAFEDLKFFILNVINKFEYERQQFERNKHHSKNTLQEQEQTVAESNKATQEALEGFEDQLIKISEIFSHNEEKSINANEIIAILQPTVDNFKNVLKKSQKDQHDLKKILTEQVQDLQLQKDTLGNLASLGILTTSFGHETQNWVNLLSNNAYHLKDDLPKYLTPMFTLISDEERSNAIDQINLISRYSDKIKTFSEFALKNVGRDKRNRKKINLSNLVNRTLSYFKDLFTEREIELELKLNSNTTKIWAFEMDWESILINLVTNAVWAMENTKQQRSRKIRITLLELDDAIKLSFADSGKGISPYDLDKIYEVGYSTRFDSNKNLIGTGMGLTIMRNFVEFYSGNIKCEPSCDLGGAQFNISIPLKNEEKNYV